MLDLPLHLVVIHFPMAILLFSVLMDVLGAATKRPGLKLAGGYSLIAGLATGAIAILTGFISANMVKEERSKIVKEVIDKGVTPPPFLEEFLEVLQGHTVVALVALGIFGAILVWRLIYWERLRGVSLSVYLLGALVASLLLLRTGYLGGQMGHDLIPKMVTLREDVNQPVQPAQPAPPAGQTTEAR